MASGGAAGAVSLGFVYSLDYARTRLANDAKSSKKGGGERQYNGLVDVYKKTIASDGVAGLYRGFNISCVGIIVYRGLYFGMYDSLKPVLLTGELKNSFLASFMLGWAITIGAGEPVLRRRCPAGREAALEAMHHARRAMHAAWWWASSCSSAAAAAGRMHTSHVCACPAAMLPTHQAEHKPVRQAKPPSPLHAHTNTHIHAADSAAAAARCRPGLVPD